jgi:hypothetical protein
VRHGARTRTDHGGGGSSPSVTVLVTVALHPYAPARGAVACCGNADRRVRHSSPRSEKRRSKKRPPRARTTLRSSNHASPHDTRNVALGRRAAARPAPGASGRRARAPGRRGRPMNGEVEEVWFPSGGLELYGRLRTSAADSPTIILLCGIGFHTFEYEPLATWLAARGVNWPQLRLSRTRTKRRSERVVDPSRARYRYPPGD